MEIAGISSSDSSLAIAGAFGSNQVDQESFMRLLVTQLQHQDPLEPTQNEEFVAQLATFSSLEQLERLNDNVVAMIALNQSNAFLSQMTQSSALIGQQVAWTDPTTGVASSGSVESIRIIDGVAFMQIDGQSIPLALVTELQGEANSVSDPTTETGSEDTGASEE